MAKASMIQKELKRARTVKKFAIKRATLKSIIKSSKASDEEKWNAQHQLQKLPRDASPCRLASRGNF